MRMWRDESFVQVARGMSCWRRKNEPGDGWRLSRGAFAHQRTKTICKFTSFHYKVFKGLYYSHSQVFIYTAKLALCLQLPAKPDALFYFLHVLKGIKRNQHFTRFVVTNLGGVSGFSALCYIRFQYLCYIVMSGVEVWEGVTPNIWQFLKNKKRCFVQGEIHNACTVQILIWTM